MCHKKCHKHHCPPPPCHYPQQAAPVQAAPVQAPPVACAPQAPACPPAQCAPQQHACSPAHLHQHLSGGQSLAQVMPFIGQFLQGMGLGGGNALAQGGVLPALRQSLGGPSIGTQNIMNMIIGNNNTLANAQAAA